LSVKGPTHSQTVCATQAVVQTVWTCVAWFDYLCNRWTIFRRVWILLRGNQVVREFEACVDTSASCCTTSPVHQWFSNRSHLLFKMLHTTANNEFWWEFIQSYTSSF